MFCTIVATTEINLTETNYMIDTSYIGATPDFGRKPFLVKARGDAGLRISGKGEESVFLYVCLLSYQKPWDAHAMRE